MAKIGDSIPTNFIVERHLAQLKAKVTLPGVCAGQEAYDWTRARRKARRNSGK